MLLVIVELTPTDMNAEYYDSMSTLNFGFRVPTYRVNDGQHDGVDLHWSDLRPTLSKNTAELMSVGWVAKTDTLTLLINHWKKVGTMPRTKLMGTIQ